MEPIVDIISWHTLIVFILLEYPMWDAPLYNTLKPSQNGCHFPYDAFKCTFLNENVWIWSRFHWFVSNGSINNIPALVQIVAWRRPGDSDMYLHFEFTITSAMGILTWASIVMTRNRPYAGCVQFMIYTRSGGPGYWKQTPRYDTTEVVASGWCGQLFGWVIVRPTMKLTNRFSGIYTGIKWKRVTILVIQSSGVVLFRHAILIRSLSHQSQVSIYHMEEPVSWFLYPIPHDGFILQIRTLC